jgi:hypothetical protein
MRDASEKFLLLPIQPAWHNSNYCQRRAKITVLEGHMPKREATLVVGGFS